MSKTIIRAAAVTASAILVGAWAAAWCLGVTSRRPEL